VKAIVNRRYGSPDVLALEEIETPTPDPDRVLIRVHAASVNALDWRMLRGKPYAARPMMGGVGTFTVQVAKALGADVTAVCSARNVDLVRSLGADRVVDYAAEDFSRDGTRYDVLVDNVGNRPLRTLRRTLTPKGRLVIVGAHGDVVGPFARWAGAFVLDRLGAQKLIVFVANVNRDDLLSLAGLVREGRLAPVIDRTYPLRDVPEAIRYLETGHARAKVVVTP